MSTADTVRAARRAAQLVRVAATICARLTIWIFGAYAVIQGVGICLGGGDRWGSPSFIVLRQLPGSPYSWGLPLAVFGATVLIGSVLRHNAVRSVGLALMAVWSLCFGFGAGQAAFIAHAATTGGPVYLKDAAVCVVLIFIDERRTRERDQQD